MPRGSGPGHTGPGDPRTGGTAAGEPALFTPGYSGGQAARLEPWTDGGSYGTGPYGTGPYGPTGNTAGKGPIRGFPPAPGQPPPLYPPGQFSAWNRAPWPESNGYADSGMAGPDSGAWPVADRGAPDTAGAGPGLAEPGYPDPGYIEADYADAGYADAGYADAGYAGPDYPALAVSDPAADVTSTQTWGVVDADSAATSGWSDLNVPGERGRHADPYSGHIPAAADYGTGLAGPAEALARPPGPGPVPGLPGPGQGSEPAGPGPGGPGLVGPDAGPAPAAPGPARSRRDQRDDRAGGRGRAAAGSTGGPTVARPGREPARRQSARGHGSRGRARPGGRTGRGRVLLAVGLVIAVVAAAAGYVWFSGRRNAGPPAAASHRAASRPSATEPSPTPTRSLGIWGHITSRASDPVPLTLAELFPAQFADGGIRYTRTVQKARAHCSGALIGSTLSAAVSHAACTQVMRASYLSSGNKLMGTIGVLNLATAAAAKTAGKAAGPAEFIAQLPAATGPTKRLTRGTGIEAAEVKGHYLVLVWAELANLRPPRSAAQRKELEAFIGVLIQKTANVSLAIRMVTGRPAA